MPMPISRRQMLRTTAAAAGVWTMTGRLSVGRAASPNEKLNIAGIGVGGRGADNVQGVASENLVALCDVDESRAAKTFEQFPQAKRYQDFRKMLDEMHGQIDAVVIGTPDHTHAMPGVMAMKLGKHCYCEKPLTHSVYEARLMATVAREKGLVTQMGTQIHAGANYRRVVELVQSGAIGPVREVHAWLGANFSGPVRRRPTCPSPTRPPTSCRFRKAWIGICGSAPPSIVRITRRTPRSRGVIGGTLQRPAGRFLLPLLRRGILGLGSAASDGHRGARSGASGERRALDHRPAGVSVARRAAPGDLALVQRRAVSRAGQREEDSQWGSAVLFIGSKGMLITDYGRHQLLPEDQFADFKRPNRSFRIRSAITANGSKPARRAG
jgi:hypothetical protein